MSLKPLADNECITLLNPYVPHKVLICHGDVNITQAEFLQDVERVAPLLAGCDYVINLCDDRYHFLVSFSAALISGVTNLLAPNKLPATLDDLQRQYPNALVIDDEAVQASLVPLSRSQVLPQIDCPQINAQHIAAIAFTSGSTGQSKPYTKHWGTLSATARMLGESLGHSESAIIIATVPSQHMYGLETTIMMPLQAGYCLEPSKPFFPKDIQDAIAATIGSAVLVSSPLHLRALVNAELAMPSLQGIVSATAPLDVELAAQCESLFAAPLHEIYGCTEVGSMAVRRSTFTNEWSLLNGFTLKNVHNFIQASAPHLSDNFLLQDNLELVSNEGFTLGGRHTDTINVAGKRTSLAYLNNELLRIKGIVDGVIFLPDNIQHEVRPAAMVVSELDEKTILAEMAKRVDTAFLPRPLRKVTLLPRAATGKITQASLQQLWKDING